MSVVDLDDPSDVARAEARHRALPPQGERAALVWQLSLELWKLAHPGEPDGSGPRKR